jgi:hypothetical protein
MEPVDVIPIERPAQANPWPVVVRMIALVVLLFAAGQLLSDALTIYMTFTEPIPAGLFPSRMQLLFSSRGPLAVVDVLACGAMIAGALLVLKQRSATLLMWVARAWVLIWAAGMILWLVAQGALAVEYLDNNTMVAAFPVAVILLLGVYQKTEPQAAPV